jgi:hypothetical protein
MLEIPPALRDWLMPVVLENKWIRLEPLSLTHVEGLAAVADDPEIWRWLPVVAPNDAAEVRALVQGASTTISVVTASHSRWFATASR